MMKKVKNFIVQNVRVVKMVFKELNKLNRKLNRIAQRKKEVEQEIEQEKIWISHRLMHEELNKLKKQIK